MATPATAAAFTQIDMDFSEYCRRGDGKRLMQLLAQGANVNCRDEHYGWTPLHHAAREGFLDIVKVLIHKGAEVNAKDSMGQTPLHRAAQRGHKKCVNLLLFAGADPVIRDSLDQTPAVVAKAERQDEVFLLLLKAEHKREKELLEERRKAEKLEEKQRKRERKEQERLEKLGRQGSARGMRKNRSLSMDDGLQHSKDNGAVSPSSPASPVGSATSESTTMVGGHMSMTGIPSSRSSGSVSELGVSEKEKKRRSFGAELFSKKKGGEEDDDGHHDLPVPSSSLPKSSKALSSGDKGDQWLGYINGEVEHL